jgi:hypothetical protein
MPHTGIADQKKCCGGLKIKCLDVIVTFFGAKTTKPRAD